MQINYVFPASWEMAHKSVSGIDLQGQEFSLAAATSLIHFMS